MQIMQSRRHFLTCFSLASAAALVSAPRSLHAEPPPETTTVRLPKYIGDICHSPPMIAGELLRAEGFTDVRYVEPKNGPDATTLIIRGEMDFDYDYAPAQIALIEAGVPITVLAGVHSGCLELIANDSVRSIPDLRGKRVGVDDYTTYPHLLLRLMVAYVGLDPERDIQWVTSKDLSSMELFATGQTDAFVGAMPEPQALRARKIGHTIFNSGVDRPWSDYLCCTLVGNAAFAREHPVATKRVLRAILKATDLCASQPKLVEQQLVDSGIATRFDDALQMLTEVPFDKWRDFDPEDTIRFFALRMHEAGMIKSSPQKIIADGTDFRFLNELKRELKA
jgi:NitT/TauT family transport system substrate-binding protein